MATNVSLPDGHELTVRPIRPDDKALLRELHAGLSEESRYRRFFAALGKLTPAMEAYLTEVDHHDHEALLARDALTLAPVAVARFVRLESHPDTAEFALTVVDAWQRRGVGTAMFALLADRAREEGVVHFVGDVMTQNMLMHQLMSMFGHVELTGRDGSVEHLALPLPEEPLSERIPELLAAATAEHH